MVPQHDHLKGFGTPTTKLKFGTPTTKLTFFVPFYNFTIVLVPLKLNKKKKKKKQFKEFNNFFQLRLKMIINNTEVILN